MILLYMKPGTLNGTIINARNINNEETTKEVVLVYLDIAFPLYMKRRSTKPKESFIPKLNIGQIGF